MRRTSILLFLAFCVSPIALAGVSFSGSWVYDAAASTLPHPGDLTIIHSGDHLIKIVRSEFGTSTNEYILDGIEHTMVLEGSTNRYRALLEGNTLHITGTITSELLSSRASDSLYILSENGKTLTRIITFKGPSGSTLIRKMVFRKQ